MLDSLSLKATWAPLPKIIKDCVRPRASVDNTVPAYPAEALTSIP